MCMLVNMFIGTRKDRERERERDGYDIEIH